MNLKLILAATAAGALCAAAPPVAHGAFPGTNGDIVFGAYDENDTAGLYAQKPGGLPGRFLETGSDTPNHADVSPDGTKVLWSSNEYEIWVADRDGSNPRQLSGEEHIDWTPSWSPDGRSIVFAHQEEDSEQWELWRMNADGSGRDEIGSGIEGTSPVLSPDGTKLAYATFDWESEGDLMLVDADGSGEPVELAEGRDPDWTPDGRSIVFGTADFDEGGLSLYRVDIATGLVDRLTDSQDGIIYGYPSVSPDGTKIVAASANFREIPRGVGIYALRTMNIDGTGAEILPGTGYARDPDWAPGPKADEPDEDDDQEPAPSPVVQQQPAPAAEQRAAAPSTTRACVSRRFFTVSARGSRLRKVSMTVHGRPVKVTRRGGAFQARVDLRGLPRGTFSVRIRKTGAGGRTVTETRRYRTCTPKRS